MRRHDFLIAPTRKDARGDRKRNQRLGQFGAADPVASELTVWMYVERKRGVTVPVCEKLESERAAEQAPTPLSSKTFFREAMHALDRDRLQISWGRVQQLGELDYEPLVEQAAATKRFVSRSSKTVAPKVLEEFLGFVDQIEDGVAYITLTSDKGETLYGEYPAAELKARGISERRRFKCRTIDYGKQVAFDLIPIPDREVSKEREREIDNRIRELLGDDERPEEVGR